MTDEASGTFNVRDDFKREERGGEVDLSLPRHGGRALEQTIVWRGKPR